MAAVLLALPACLAGTCDMSSPVGSAALPMDMTSHHAMLGLPVLMLGSVCGMAESVPPAIEDALLPYSPSSFLGLVAVLTLVALVIKPRLRFLPIRFLAGALAPPGDLRGVRLLI